MEHSNPTLAKIPILDTKRRNDVKARTTLLLALPDEHQLRFSKYKTAKELWAAILKTFDGNEATRKTKKNQLKQQYGNFKVEGKETLEQTFNRLQAIVSHLEFMDVEIEQDDLNQKLLTSLALEWLMHTIVWRNRSDLGTMSLDDLCNHFKVYEPEVQKKLDSQNMAFISSAKTSSGKEEVNTASFSTASTQVSPASANVAAASISLDTACTYIASQSNGSQIKYEDINQIGEDDIEEMDIKWNMALLSMRADRFWKKTGKRSLYKVLMWLALISQRWGALTATRWATLLGSAGFPGAKTWVEEKTTDKKNTESLNSKITKLSEKLSDTKTNFYHYKLGLSRVEARLVEFKNQEIKFCEKIRGLEFKVESKTNRINSLTNELEMLKKEKEGLDSKLTGFQSASKDLANLLGSQRSDKNKEGLGYSDVTPPAQVYSPPKKDMSWTRLPEFTDDTITDYIRPSPSIESNSNNLQNNSSSVSENEESTSSILSKPEIKFVKAADGRTVIKTNKDETVRKPSVKYAEMYRKTSKSSNVEKGKSRPKNNTHKSLPPKTVFHKSDRSPTRTTRPNMNVAQPRRTSFYKLVHSYVKRPFQKRSAVRTQFWVPKVPTVSKNFPTVTQKFPTGNSKLLTADLGNKGKVVKASACWIWRPKQNSTVKGPNSNSVSVIFKKYQYIDTQGRLKYVVESYSDEEEPTEEPTEDSIHSPRRIQNVSDEEEPTEDEPMEDEPREDEPMEDGDEEDLVWRVVSNDVEPVNEETPQMNEDSHINESRGKKRKRECVAMINEAFKDKVEILNENGNKIKELKITKGALQTIKVEMTIVPSVIFVSLVPGSIGINVSLQSIIPDSFKILFA
nr:hypothetical protein [Tanacetum cinerariifolium]